MKSLPLLLASSLFALLTTIACADGVSFEGEALAGSARASEGHVARQNMGYFDGSWSGNKQLFWMPSRQGSTLELTVHVPAAGRYELAGWFTKAPDYATITAGANGKVIGTFNGYASQISNSGRTVLGTVDLAEGNQKILLQVSRKAALSTGYFVGIDRLELNSSEVDNTANNVSQLTPQ